MYLIYLCIRTHIDTQMTGFFIAATFKFDTITDILGSTNFVVIAAISFFAGPITYSKVNHETQ